jgi:hypothetical protein
MLSYRSADEAETAGRRNSPLIFFVFFNISIWYRSAPVGRLFD